MHCTAQLKAQKRSKVTKTLSNNSKQKYLREEYISRINRVMDYIEVNIVQDLSLENLAEVANFSRFHFHRIFRAMVGETLHQFIQRIRLEKAAAQTIVKTNLSRWMQKGLSTESPFYLVAGAGFEPATFGL